ncbi:MAG: hypothetical protein A3K19_03560 [Lentisphaerae bacterium RIFOXYB12_FULL_65_16]|nr:MAG: hypothetical protein A3K18_30150 [Lentisphaerae bacterium RIFOXYA12_64_32]OGV86591.1 MAG: hypothetical protein A3K19_03560 [Lentisphaerae bacterium RIFOXYB12_FULL_65_16]
MKRYVRGILAACALAAAFVIGTAARAEDGGRMAGGGITFGTLGGDHYIEGSTDVFIPFWLDETQLIFLDPRCMLDDNDEQETNIGLGYRFGFPDMNLILGANAFYDSRWTESDNQFDQIGVGGEILQEWFDARFNYYWPEDNEKSVGGAPVGWGDGSASGHGIVQQGYGNVEAPREGWDGELGFKVPFICKWLDLRVYGGYYWFDSELSDGDELDGFRGRLEARILPGVILDAEVYEDDDLIGSDWLVGCRVRVPFDLGSVFEGKNPFAGTMEQFKGPQPTPFTARMTEMVMRDRYLHMETGVSDSPTSTQTVLDDVAFVDLDGGDDDNPGTAEAPFRTIEAALASGYTNIQLAESSEDAYEPYVDRATNNFNIPANVSLYGLVPLNGGRVYSGRGRAWVNGTEDGPTLELGGNNTVYGLRITHSDTGLDETSDNISNTDTSMTGVYAVNKTNLTIQNNVIIDCTNGIVISANDSLDNLNVAIKDNAVRTDGSAAIVYADRNGGGRAAGPTFTGTFSSGTDGEFTGFDGDGLRVYANGFDTVTMTFTDMKANDNSASGIDVRINDAVEASVTFSGVNTVTHNGWGGGGGDGVYVDINTTGGILASFSGLDVSDNGDDGLAVDLYDDGTGGVVATFNGITASSNGYDGIYADIWSNGGNVSATFEDITANDNGYYDDDDQYYYGVGVDVDDIGTGAGNVSATFSNITADGNAEEGMYVNSIGSEAGNVSVTVTNVSANRNSNDNWDEDGILFDDIWTDAGSITLLFDAITADYNGDGGLDVWAGATGGNVSGTFSNIAASWNDSSDGVTVGTEANLGGTRAAAGDTTLSFTNITGDGNDNDLIDVDADGDGTLTATFSNISGSGNGNNLIDAWLYPDDGGSVAFSNITGSSNGEWDVGGDLQAIDGNVSATFSNITSNHVQDDVGIGFNMGTDNGSASATFSNVNVQDAAYDGIYLEIYGTTSISTTLTNVVAKFNGIYDEDPGVYIEAYEADRAVGTITISGTNNVFANNYGDGLAIDANNATDYLLNFGTAASAGNNSFYNNGGDGLSNYGSGTVSAEKNWWGNSEPSTSGDVNAGSPLTSDPNPH